MKIIQGNIFEVAKEGIIAHQTNCFGVMGAGVALSFKGLYPQIFEEYRELCEEKRNHPEDLIGTIQYVKLNKDLIGVNIFSQFQYNSTGNNTKQTLEQVLINSVNLICVTSDMEVYIPYLIGCGLGGGDWDVVEKGISHNKNLTVVKYTPPTGG